MKKLLPFIAIFSRKPIFFFLTLSSAVIYFISFMPFNYGFPAFISLTPFFYTLIKTDSLKKAAMYGAIWGVTLTVLFSIPLYHALVREYDLSIIFSSLLILVTVYLPYAVIYGIYGILFKYFSYKKSTWFPLVAASIWLLIDYTAAVTPFFIPWGFIGYSQANNIFIQLSDLTGIYGVTFLIVLTNLLLSEIMIHKMKYSRFSILLILLILFSAVIYGSLRKQNINYIIRQSDKTEFKAAIIQGNFNPEEKWNSKNKASVINTYINMTIQILGKADVFVWPETVLNSSDSDNLQIIAEISSLLKNNQIFIAGGTRHSTKKTVYNSIFTADKNGLNYIYDKKILFPFTETPLSGISSGNFMDSPAVFTSGKTIPVYRYESAVFGFTICFETIYPEYIRYIKNSGADIIINTANDSWFGNTYEPYMQQYSAIARGVENRIYVLRSSNSGISSVISPAGEVVSSIDLNKRDKIVSSVNTVQISSFYSKNGDWIIVVSLFIIMLSLVFQLKIRK